VKRALVLLLLPACGPTDNFYVPVGFVGSIGFCHARSASGAVSIDDSGWVRADRVGHGDVRCNDGGHEGVGVRALARLAIEGPDHIEHDQQIYYRVHAYDSKGEELSLVDEQRIEWTSSDGGIQPGYCSDMPLLGCPGVDSAMVQASPGPLTITVSYLGQSVVKKIVVQ
jgi:hypothetical protein